MRVTTEITLDIARETVSEVVYAKQWDRETRAVVVTLTERGRPYSIPEGVTAYAYIKKPDKKVCYLECGIENGKVVIELTNQALAAAGTAYSEVQLVGTDGKRLSSATFILNVAGAVYDENAIRSCNEVTFLEKMVQSAEAWANRSKEYAERAALTQINPNLLDNWYFGGAEILAHKGVPYYSEAGALLGTLINEQKIFEVGPEWCKFQGSSSVGMVHTSDCYQKSGTFPVNQRGKVSYGALYGVDRWFSYGMKVVVKNTHIEFENVSGANNTMRISREDKSMSSDKTLCFSYLDANDQLYFGTLPFASYVTIGDINVYRDYHLSVANTSSLFLKLKADVSNVAIKAVKLEFGDKQTLAHQDENGNWVLNEIPDYGTELAKCQRYFIKLSEIVCAACVFMGVLYSFINTPVTMRTKSIGFISGEFDYISGDTISSFENGISNRVEENGIAIQCAFSDESESSVGVLIFSGSLTAEL